MKAERPLRSGGQHALLPWANGRRAVHHSAVMHRGPYIIQGTWLSTAGSMLTCQLINALEVYSTREPQTLPVDMKKLFYKIMKLITIQCSNLLRIFLLCFALPSTSVLILDDSAQKSILRGSNVRTDVKRKTVSVS